MKRNEKLATKKRKAELDVAFLKDCNSLGVFLKRGLLLPTVFRQFCPNIPLSYIYTLPIYPSPHYIFSPDDNLVLARVLSKVLIGRKDTLCKRATR